MENSCFGPGRIALLTSVVSRANLLVCCIAGFMSVHTSAVGQTYLRPMLGVETTSFNGVVYVVPGGGFFTQGIGSEGLLSDPAIQTGVGVDKFLGDNYSLSADILYTKRSIGGFFAGYRPVRYNFRFHAVDISPSFNWEFFEGLLVMGAGPTAKIYSDIIKETIKNYASDEVFESGRKEFGINLSSTVRHKSFLIRFRYVQHLWNVGDSPENVGATRNLSAQFGYRIAL